jgi:hypothetical protein
MRSAAIVLVFLSAFGFAGCADSEIVQDLVSPDGVHWARVLRDRGNALEHDWYGILIAKVHPSRIDSLTRRDSQQICTLQGRGEISMSWAGPHTLQIQCMKCDKNECYVSSRHWDGVDVSFNFKD